MAESFFDTLRPASFRGVSFEVESHTENGGRRLAKHEYPLRDLPFAEDLGRKAGQWQVEAFLVRNKQTDYAQARDSLREALNAAGPGTLIHPYLGELTVSVDAFSLRETTREGGYCTFSITFAESGQPEEPDARKDTAIAAVNSAAALATVAGEGFLAEYAPLLDDLGTLIEAAPRILGEALNALAAPLAYIEQVQQFAADVLLVPEAMLTEVTGRINGVAGLMSMSSLPSMPRLNLDSLTSLFSRRASVNGSQTTGGLSHAGTSVPSGASGSSGVTGRAIRPLVDLAAATVIAQAATATAETDYATADDALADRDRLSEAIDIIQDGCPDRLFAALSDLRAAVQEDLTTRGAQLPRLAVTRLPATMPALAAAHILYGDAARADDIVTRNRGRNRVRHPGRVPGGVDLEVLNV